MPIHILKCACKDEQNERGAHNDKQNGSAEYRLHAEQSNIGRNGDKQKQYGPGWRTCKEDQSYDLGIRSERDDTHAN